MGLQPAHVDMLRELGIDVDCEDYDQDPIYERSSSPILPDRPHHFDDDGTAIFTTDQILWCNPSELGYKGTNYIVVETELTAHPPALNYSDEINLPKKRPVHHYSRFERFRACLNQILCSSRMIVPDYVMDTFREKLKGVRRRHIWSRSRKIIKDNKWRYLYNRIPAILAELGYAPKQVGIDTRKYNQVLRDFFQMDHIFDKIKQRLGREYFLDMRYVSIKLMEKNQMKERFNIPRALTKTRRNSLDLLFAVIWHNINKFNIEL